MSETSPAYGTPKTLPVNCPYIPQMIEEYRNASIVNIQRGKVRKEHPYTKGRENITAHIVNAKGQLLVSATLDYCVATMKEVSQYF